MSRTQRATAGFEDGGHVSRKWGSQSYNHKELILSKTWISLEADSSPEPPDRSPDQMTPWFQLRETLRKEPSQAHLGLLTYRTVRYVVLSCYGCGDGLCSERMNLRSIIRRDVLGQKTQDHLSRATCREGLPQIGKGRGGASPVLQPKCRWLPGSLSNSFPGSFPGSCSKRVQEFARCTWRSSTQEGRCCIFLFSSRKEKMWGKKERKVIGYTDSFHLLSTWSP